jgi:hypothetical protein
MPVFAAPHIRGLRNHLLQAPARVLGDKRTRAREHGADDSPGGGARDDVDHDAQLDPAADLPQQIEIDLLGVEFGIATGGGIEKRSGRTPRPVGDRMQGAGGADQLQDFLADAMHIDGERNTAETDQRNAKLLLSQGNPPAGVAVS